MHCSRGGGAAVERLERSALRILRSMRQIMLRIKIMHGMWRKYILGNSCEQDTGVNDDTCSGKPNVNVILCIIGQANKRSCGLQNPCFIHLKVRSH